MREIEKAVRAYIRDFLSGGADERWRDVLLAITSALSSARSEGEARGRRDASPCDPGCVHCRRWRDAALATPAPTTAREPE